MKKIILLSIITIAAYTAIFAQITTIQIPAGTTGRTFKALNPTGATTYNWSTAIVSGGGSTLTDPSTGHAQTTIPIDFSSTVGATSTLSVTPVSTNGCSGSASSISLVIETPALMSYIAGITLPSAVCDGSTFSATITITGTGSTATVSGANPISIYYSFNGTPAASPVTMSSASQIVSFPEVLTAAGSPYTYLITGVSFGSTLSTNNVSQAVNVDAVPTVTGIQ